MARRALATRLVALGALAGMLSAAPAVALVVVSDKGSAKAPRDDPGWGNVGSV